MMAANHPRQKVRAHLLSALEAAREKRELTQSQVAAAAGMDVSTYRRLVTGITRRPKPAIISKLMRVISGLRAPPNLTARENLVRATYAGFLLQTSAFHGVTPEQVRALAFGDKRTKDPHVLACARARQAALYLVNIALEIKQAELAKLFGVSSAAICLALQAVEMRRDDAAFDAFLDRAQARITGEAA